MKRFIFLRKKILEWWHYAVVKSLMENLSIIIWRAGMTKDDYEVILYRLLGFQGPETIGALKDFGMEFEVIR